MIHELRITDLGVIAEAACSFAPGFTTVTGETGAGKTMVVSGLGLLTGGRADVGLVRSGADRAAIEGWFDRPDRELSQVVEDAGGVLDDQGLTAARIVATRGRSVLGGRGVPVAVLGEVVGGLLVIHGQHDQTRIGARALALLDSFAGSDTLALADEVRGAVTELRGLETEVAALRQGAMERARELDVLEFSLAEIAEVDPQPGEDATLATESERLANADTLLAAAHTAREAIASDSDLEGVGDAMGRLATARRELESAAAHDPDLAGAAAAIRSVMAQLGELAADLSRYAQDIEADPRRLAAVQQRQADLGRLLRKYGADVSEVLAWAQDAAGRAAALTGADDRIEHLATQIAALRERLATRCVTLHEQRAAAAQRFAEQVTSELSALAMPRARVEFALTSAPDPAGLAVPGHDMPLALRPTGLDDCALLLAANPGAPLRPIAQAASGGELSRVMLAVQVVLAGADPVPTMVFDEVDAGVGGAAAIEVGRRLQALSRSTQVIVVTHLAQVAAFADRHLVVTKDSEGSVTASSVVAVAGDARVRELSRMLGGMAQSHAAGEHARELLDLAHGAARASRADRS